MRVCSEGFTRVWRVINTRVMWQVLAVDSRATHGCWCSSKVVHCTKKYWGINTTTGKYEHVRQFFSVAMTFYSSCLAPPAVTLHLHPSVLPSQAVYPSPSLFGSLLLLLSLRLHCPNLLFPLLVFMFASQSHSSRRFWCLRSRDSLFSC